MQTVWGVNLSDKCAGRLKATCALTAGMAGDGWQDIDTAPKDGTEVELRVVHFNAAFTDAPMADGWVEYCRAKWIDHNNGGWTWNGLCGVPCQWRPI